VLFVGKRERDFSYSVLCWRDGWRAVRVVQIGNLSLDRRLASPAPLYGPLNLPPSALKTFLTAANMFTPERRPIDSRGSGKSAVGNGLLSVQAFSWCQNVPKRPLRDQIRGRR